MANKRRRNEEEARREVAKTVKTTSSYGVRTRAKSTALMASMDNVGDGCYLHLRSRRLERYPKATKKECLHNKKGNFDLHENQNVGVVKRTENEGENRMVEIQHKEFKGNETTMNKEEEQDDDNYSFGENDLDFDNKERICRESTPSSLMMGKDEITASSSSSSNKATINQIRNPIIPSLQDLEDFFADAEKHRIFKFINKYNFDIEKEKPLKGRFEWVKIKP